MNNDQDNGNSTILVADDEEYIVRVVAFKLRGAGYEVIEAVDGEDAWSKIREGGIDLVLTDHQICMEADKHYATGVVGIHLGP